MIPWNQAVLEKMTLDSNQPSTVGRGSLVVESRWFLNPDLFLQWSNGCQLLRGAGPKLSTQHLHSYPITWRSSWSKHHRETSLVVDVQCSKKKQKR